MERAFLLTLKMFALAVQVLDGPVNVVKCQYAILHALQDAVFYQMFVIALEQDSQVLLATFILAKFLVSIADTVWDLINVTVLIQEDILVLTVKFQYATKVLMEDVSIVEYAKLHNTAIAQELVGMENGANIQFVTETSAKMEETALVLMSVIAPLRAT